MSSPAEGIPEENRRAAGVLADGTPPAVPGDLLAILQELAIVHETIEHPAVYTVEESKALRGDLDGTHVKNLFLRNKKGGMWLLTCQEDRRVDLKALAQRVGAGRFSFASAERLMHHLGVIPGAVTPFAAVNDRPGRVRMLLDFAVAESDRLNLHPLVNTMTTVVSGADLLRFLDHVGHPAQVVPLDDICR